MKDSSADMPRKIGVGRRRTQLISSQSGSENQASSAEEPISWSRRMSNNLAYAFLVYTGLQIFLTVHTMTKNEASLMPYLVLIVLVAGVIPACRWFERRWRDLPSDQAHNPALAGKFRADVIGLWTMAVGLPLLITLLYSLRLNMA